MATFYKYAERNAQSQINWAEVGRNITDTLREEARIREEKIATIDENTRQLGITIENSPQGEHEGLNQWGLELGSNAQEMRLIQDRLLRSGQLNLRDYTKMRQNLSDGVDGFFTALEEYQAEYANKMEKWRKNESQPLDQWLMAQVEGLSNFTVHKPVFDPMTSQLYIAKMKEDGSIDNNPNTYVSVNSLRNRIKANFDRFKTDDYAEQVASRFGVETFEVAKRAGTTWGKILSKQGIRGTVNEEDQAAIKAYEIAENAAIDAAFANPYNITSVLTVEGMGYNFTWDPNAAKNDPNLILLKNDAQNGYPTPDFTTANGEKQKEAATELMRNIIRSKMDKKTEEKTFSIAQVTPRTPTKQTEGEISAQTNASMIGRLYTGGQDLQTALDYFRGRLPEGTEIRRTPQGVTIINPDRTSKEIKFTNADGSERRQDQFIEAAASILLGEGSSNVIGLVQKGGYSQGVFDPTSVGSAIVQKPKTITQMFTERVKAFSVPPTEEEAQTALEAEFGGAGFKFEQTTPGFDAIQVIAPNGKKASFYTKEDAEKLKNFISNNFDARSISSGYMSNLKTSDTAGIMAAPSPSPSPSPQTKEDQSINYEDLYQSP